MQQDKRKPSKLILKVACLLGTAAMCTGTTWAANGLSPDEQYRQAIERCDSGQSGQDIATCKKEAAAALQEARRSQLVIGAPDYNQNMLIRCESLPAEQREECQIQMSGSSSTVRTLIEGSVEGGGILRRTEIITPGRVIQEGSEYTPSTADPAMIRQAEKAMQQR